LRWSRLGIISAALYATGLALGAEVRLASAPASGCSMPRKTAIACLAPQHDRTSSRVMGATERSLFRIRRRPSPLLGAEARDLLGLRPVSIALHVADRPAYLTGLGRHCHAR